LGLKRNRSSADEALLDEFIALTSPLLHELKDKGFTTPAPAPSSSALPATSSAPAKDTASTSHSTSKPKLSSAAAAADDGDYFVKGRISWRDDVEMSPTPASASASASTSGTQPQPQPSHEPDEDDIDFSLANQLKHPPQQPLSPSFKPSTAPAAGPPTLTQSQAAQFHMMKTVVSPTQPTRHLQTQNKTTTSSTSSASASSSSKGKDLPSKPSASASTSKRDLTLGALTEALAAQGLMSLPSSHHSTSSSSSARNHHPSSAPGKSTSSTHHNPPASGGAGPSASGGAAVGTGGVGGSTSKLLRRMRSSLFVADCRPLANAFANVAKNGGWEVNDHYPNCRVQFLDIENIHVVRSAFQELRDLFTMTHRVMAGAATTAQATSTHYYRTLQLQEKQEADNKAASAGATSPASSSTAAPATASTSATSASSTTSSSAAAPALSTSLAAAAAAEVPAAPMPTAPTAFPQLPATGFLTREQLRSVLL
jgi:hypothetical protein